MRPSLILPALTLLALSQAVVAAPVRYEIRPGRGSKIIFTSKAPLESFDGSTDHVSGWFIADLEDLSAGVEIEVHVDLASFDTGNKKRNGHMRKNHLETDRYPRATFRGGDIVSPSAKRLEPGKPLTARINGTLDLHGVAHPMSIPVNLTRMGGDVVQVACEFPVSLGDFSIKRPRFLVMKLADEQKVRVTLEAVVAP